MKKSLNVKTCEVGRLRQGFVYVVRENFSRHVLGGQRGLGVKD